MKGPYLLSNISIIYSFRQEVAENFSQSKSSHVEFLNGTHIIYNIEENSSRITPQFRFYFV
jgi:hypothetical protein